MKSDYKKLGNPPKYLNAIMTLEQLQILLEPLVGQTFRLTGKPRTDGSQFRVMVSDLLLGSKCECADDSFYTIIPPKKKGVPRLLIELLDTYLVTTGDTYNLQVWNRIPNSNDCLVEYSNGDVIESRDIRYVFAKIDSVCNKIESIVILSPNEIENKFGIFGKPTIKHQLLITDKKRSEFLCGDLLVESCDSITMSALVKSKYIKPKSMLSKYDSNDLLSIKVIKERVEGLRGVILASSDTKTRGQLLERKVSCLLGYDETDSLVGGYPDIPNQMLEVKVQDSPTIDLGAHSPRIKETIVCKDNITTQDVRYLIALTDSKTNAIEGIILTCGECLGDYFTYVSEQSFKCQRSIPMEFFEQQKGKCVVNPEFKKPC